MLRVGESHDLNELAETLTAAGYTRCEQVEGVGQFALRGGILDFFSPAQARPVRVEFFGDEIDAMGLFDPDTQRRVENSAGGDPPRRRGAAPARPRRAGRAGWRPWTA